MNYSINVNYSKTTTEQLANNFEDFFLKIQNEIESNRNYQDSDKAMLSKTVKKIQDRISASNSKKLGTMTKIAYLYNQVGNSKDKKIRDFSLKMTNDEINVARNILDSSHITESIQSVNQIDIISIKRLKSINEKYNNFSIEVPDLKKINIESTIKKINDEEKKVKVTNDLFKTNKSY